MVVIRKRRRVEMLHRIKAEQQHFTKQLVPIKAKIAECDNILSDLSSLVKQAGKKESLVREGKSAEEIKKEMGFVPEMDVAGCQQFARLQLLRLKMFKHQQLIIELQSILSISPKLAKELKLRVQILGSGNYKSHLGSGKSSWFARTVKGQSLDFSKFNDIKYHAGETGIMEIKSINDAQAILAYNQGKLEEAVHQYNVEGGNPAYSKLGKGVHLDSTELVLVRKEALKKLK